MILEEEVNPVVEPFRQPVGDLEGAVGEVSG